LATIGHLGVVPALGGDENAFLFSTSLGWRKVWTESTAMTEIVLPDLCDAHGDAVSVLEPMFVNFGGVDSFGGPVVTVKCFEDNSLVADQLALPGGGQVLVVDGGGSLRCALLGDNLARKGADNGWAGIVVYGCVRDVDVLAETPIGVQALAPHPRRSVKKGIGELNVPVTFAGVTIRPGEFVYADGNGVITSAEALVRGLEAAPTKPGHL